MNGETAGDVDARIAATLRRWGESYASNPTWSGDLGAMWHLWSQIQRNTAAIERVDRNMIELRRRLRNLERLVDDAADPTARPLNGPDIVALIFLKLKDWRLRRRVRAERGIDVLRSRVQQLLEQEQQQRERLAVLDKQLRQSFSSLYKGACEREDGI